MRIKLQHVDSMPKVLEPEILYVSLKYGTAAHLCPCGCGEKIRTPLGSVDWRLTDGKLGPSLYPSIGNWQKPCRSHYWIRNGKIVWAGDWSEDEVLEGRRREELRAQAHYEALDCQESGYFSRLKRWLLNIFKNET